MRMADFDGDRRDVANINGPNTRLRHDSPALATHLTVLETF